MSHLHRAFFNTSDQIDVFSLHHDIGRALREAQIQNGLVTAYSPNGTTALTILEKDETIQEALKILLKSFVPEPNQPRPQRKSGTGNLEFHLRAALLSSSLSIPVQDGRLLLGHWQEVFVYDFDNRAGRCEIQIQVLGEQGQAQGQGGRQGPPGMPPGGARRA